MSKLEIKYDGDALLKDLKTLKQVKTMRDVTNITHTQFPGTHCPLMGALLVVRGIKDAQALVVGTDECVYYSKSMSMGFDGFGGLRGRVASVRLDTNDVTFGSVEKVEAAFKELIEESNPSCIFLISTCLIEIIGDDFDALAEKIKKQYNIPVLSIHTEHFKSEDHLPGIERALCACTQIMEKQEQNSSVNLLGQRFGEFNKSELSDALLKENIEINLQLPKECSLDDIRTATKAKLNIVLNATALDLAKTMQEKFDIPYVEFDKYSSPETNYNAYKELFAKLEKEVPSYVTEKYNKVKTDFENAKDKYKGLRYIYGGAPFASFETIKIMCEFGLEPLLLQISKIEPEHANDIEEITKYFDPYVTRSANVTGIAHVYDTLKPDLNFGPAYMQTLMEKKIVPVRFDNSSDMIGFELCELLLTGIENAKIAADKYKGAK